MPQEQYLIDLAAIAFTRARVVQCVDGTSNESHAVSAAVCKLSTRHFASAYQLVGFLGFYS